MKLSREQKNYLIRIWSYIVERSPLYHNGINSTEKIQEIINSNKYTKEDIEIIRALGLVCKDYLNTWYKWK